MSTAADGDIRFDPHVKVLDERIVERAKARGLDAIVYAPHFTRLPDIRERARAFSGPDLAVMPGREVFTGNWRHRKHVLALGLSDPVPDFITLDGAMRAFDEQDATVLVPHPAFLTVSLDVADIRRYAESIDGIEVYNPKHSRWHNRRADAIAEALGIPRFASSYAHLRGTVGEAWTAVEGPIETEADLLAALDPATPREVGRRSGGSHRIRCAIEASHLAWENSWQKLDRVVLSGREATHPAHPAYGGRFADVAVY